MLSISIGDFASFLSVRLGVFGKSTDFILSELSTEKCEREKYIVGLYPKRVIPDDIFV